MKLLITNKCKFIYELYKTQKSNFMLADGTVFEGKSIGKDGTSFGEICFNTAMTGYQEVFTDPSYFGQIMLSTNAHIGNYGVNENEWNLIQLKFQD